jgi:universal stress protein A
MQFKPADQTGGVIVKPAPKAAAASPVFKLKTILVPVDFSDCSKKALQYAIPFARQFDAELILLHVVPSYPPVPEMAPVDTESIEDAKKDLEAFRMMIGDAARSDIVVRWGEPDAAILMVAKEFGVDLIILSTHGRTGLARVILGSTAEKVVRHARCPVLVVREHQHEFITVSAGNLEHAA